MKTVIKNKSGVYVYTKDQILENIKANDGLCYFHLTCYWEEGNYDSLNFLVDDEVECGSFLCDVSYKPISLNEDDTITFEVCAVDTGDYIKYSDEIDWSLD